MGLVKGTLMFLLTSLLLISLTFGNLALTLSLSIGQDNFQNEFVKNIASVIAEETQGNEEFEFGLENAKQVCLNNTEFKVNVNGTDVSIPCERVQEGSQAVIEESIKDLVFEQESKSVKCDNPINCFIKYKDILFSEEAKNYWNKMFYFSLVATLTIIGAMFFIVEEKLSLPISVGIMTVISSLPFFVINFILPAFKISFLKPVSILFSQSYFVFLLMLGTGAVLITLGLGIKFFKMGYKISELFNKKSDKKGEIQN